MLKQKYFLTDFFILSAEKQPIKSSWRKIEWLPEKGKVFIGSEKYMDKYDFNMDGRPFRDFATWVERPGKANDGKDFLIYGYGYAIVPVVK